MTTTASPRRVTWLTGAGFLFLGVALVTWAWCAWTNWWLADVHGRPARELDAPLAVSEGAQETVAFTPNAGIPHLLHVEFDSGFPAGGDGPSPIELEWSVRVGDRVLVDSDGDADGAGHFWRAGEPGMGIVWLGKFDADRDEEHVVTTRVVRGLPAATARLLAVRDAQSLKNAMVLARLLSMIAWVPAGLGLALLLIAWFRRRFQIRRRA